MLHVDIPTSDDLKALREFRADFCVSIYLAATPLFARQRRNPDRA